MKKHDQWSGLLKTLKADTHRSAKRGRGRPRVMTPDGRLNREVWADMLAEEVLELVAAMARGGRHISRREAERRVAIGILTEGAGYFSGPDLIQLPSGEIRQQVECREDVKPDPIKVKKLAKAIQNELLWLRRQRGGVLRSRFDKWFARPELAKKKRRKPRRA